MKIAVLCGGTSTEREVSLKTSEKVAMALKSKGHQVILVDAFLGTHGNSGFDVGQDIADAAQQYRAMTCLINDEMRKSRDFFGPGVIEICKEADIVFIGLHGENGEDGKVQAAFDLMNVKYTGSGYLGSAVAMSKKHTKSVLSGVIPMPEGIVLDRKNPFRERFSVPCVIKPSNGGSSVGVRIVENDADYDEALMYVFKYDETVLVEEYIKGRELTQGVLGGRALPPVEIIPEEGFYDYERKYNGKTLEVCPADITREVLEEMSRYSLLAGEILGLSVYYRIDYILDNRGRLFALEANTLPGMTDTSLIPQEAAAEGVDYPELCELIIDLSMEKYR
ncbi:MAG: D-alanine--D-alanine ligase family protein [Lachnospiraceae bacterium]